MIFKFVVLSSKGKFPSLPLLNSCRWTKNKFYVCIYFFLAALDLCCCSFFLVAASEVSSSLQCEGFSLQWLLLLPRIGFGHTNSVVRVHRPCCCVPCESSWTRDQTHVPGMGFLGRWILIHYTTKEVH